MSDCRFGVSPVNYPDPGPDVIHNTKIHKQFSLRNGCLTQSMHHSDDIKIKLITMIKQRKILLAKSKSTASHS